MRHVDIDAGRSSFEPILARRVRFQLEGRYEGQDVSRRGSPTRTRSWPAPGPRPGPRPRCGCPGSVRRGRRGGGLNDCDRVRLATGGID
jgi:hypothetical protein